MSTKPHMRYFVVALSAFIFLFGSQPIWAQNTSSSSTPSSDTAEQPSADKSSAETAQAPSLPAYFSGANTDPQKPTWPDPTGGAAGVWATPAGDGKGDIPSALTTTDLYDRIVHNLFSINVVWVMVTGFLVMFMQAGFAMVETGLCRAKNSAHTISMNFMIYPLGCIAFWAYGFALGWGNWFNGPVAPGWYSSLGPGTSVLNSGIGIGAAMDSAGNPTGAMAERWSWKNFCIYGIWVALPYCLYANWVWGGGWLAQGGINWQLGHGAVDFAGSGVVHAMGGFIGLAGALVLGARIGKYRDGKPQPIPGHHIPMVIVGTFVLAFGWFGFNPGSTLSGTDLRLSVVVVNTMLAGIAGAIGAMLTLYSKGMKPDPSMMCNGMLAGLVAITAPCAFVDSWAAVIIGALAGLIVVYSVFFWDRLHVDDPVGAISVHGINGLWGVISVGLFANGKYGAGWNGVVREEFVQKYGSDGVRGLLFGDPSQFGMQLIDAAVVAIFGFLMAYAWFKISNLITPIRVSAETEIEGLDGPEMGAMGYPDFTVTSRGA